MLKEINKEKVFYAATTLLIAIIIFYASTITGTGLESPKFNLSVIYHFGIFFMFTFFLTLLLKDKRLNKKKILIILLISLVYALSDEFHQLFVPGRFASIADALIDLGGSICSIILIRLVERLRR
jgi:VanZ family protein